MRSFVPDPDAEPKADTEALAQAYMDAATCYHSLARLSL